jgi:hypothetical protein
VRFDDAGRFRIRPPDRNDIDIAVAIDVYGNGAIMMFVAGVKNVLTPASTATIKIFEQQQPRHFRVFEIVLADDDIRIAVTIDEHAPVKIRQADKMVRRLDVSGDYVLCPVCEPIPGCLEPRQAILSASRL